MSSTACSHEMLTQRAPFFALTPLQKGYTSVKPDNLKTRVWFGAEAKKPTFSKQVGGLRLQSCKPHTCLTLVPLLLEELLE